MYVYYILCPNASARVEVIIKTNNKTNKTNVFIFQNIALNSSFLATGIRRHHCFGQWTERGINA